MATRNDENNQANEVRPFHFDLIIDWLDSEADADLITELTSQKADLITEIKSARDHEDGRCSGTGRVVYSTISGDGADTQLVICPTCNGYGFVPAPADATPVTTWPEELTG